MENSAYREFPNILHPLFLSPEEIFRKAPKFPLVCNVIQFEQLEQKEEEM